MPGGLRDYWGTSEPPAKLRASLRLRRTSHLRAGGYRQSSAARADCPHTHESWIVRSDGHRIPAMLRSAFGEPRTRAPGVSARCPPGQWSWSSAARADCPHTHESWIVRSDGHRIPAMLRSAFGEPRTRAPGVSARCPPGQWSWSSAARADCPGNVYEQPGRCSASLLSRLSRPSRPSHT